MNDRIKELIEEATIVYEGWKDDVGTVRYYDFNQEKFAELIVRESADMLACEYGQSATSGNEAAIFLRKHFGVE